MNKRRLGRGLEALLGREDGGFEPGSVDEADLSYIAVDQIDPNPFQPRRHFDPAEIAALADSLRQHGMIQQVRQGLDQLLQEGVIQVLHLKDTASKTPLLAAVGPLQFEVVQYRLESEYGAP